MNNKLYWAIIGYLLGDILKTYFTTLGVSENVFTIVGTVIILIFLIKEWIKGKNE